METLPPLRPSVPSWVAIQGTVIMGLWNSVGRFFGVAGSPDASLGGASRPKSSLFGPGLTMKGTIEGEGDLSIAGQFEGVINVSGTVLIEKGAIIEAEVTAFDVMIAGRVRGHLTASRKVEILPTGALTGSLKTGSLTAAEGASVRGEIWVEPVLQTEAAEQEDRLKLDARP
jgi:cytoskeletal protein CcmA (bactofilin family)